MQSLRESFAPNPPVALPEDVIDDYLDHLALGLSPLPPTVRAEIRHEVGQHLRAAAAVREESGLEPAAAARDAALRFGAPEKIAVRFVRVWEDSSGVVTPWRTVLTGLASVSVAAIVLAVIGVGHDPLYLTMAWTRHEALVLALSVLPGAVTGLAAPTRPTLRWGGVLGWAVGATVAGVALVAVLPGVDLLFAFGEPSMLGALGPVVGRLSWNAPIAAVIAAAFVHAVRGRRLRRLPC